MLRICLSFAVSVLTLALVDGVALRAQQKADADAKASESSAQDSSAQDSSAQDSSAQDLSAQDLSAQDLSAQATERERKLANYLSGIKFVGKFTIDGKEDVSPKTEEYTISKCEKLPQKDMYRMTARIKYGDVDSEVPLDLTILWSGNTPVITLDSFWIPGMGTFGARVLIHGSRYAGTWQHDAVGGHMFGKLVKDDAEN